MSKETPSFDPDSPLLDLEALNIAIRAIEAFRRSAILDTHQIIVALNESPEIADRAKARTMAADALGLRAR